VTGIRANAARCREYVERSIGVVTALVPILGYEVSTRLAARALAEDRGIVELVREEGLLSEERIAHLLAPERMVRDVNGPL
jgi:aspartate ammonia-lyase